MRKEILILGSIILLVIVGAYIASTLHRSSVQNENKADSLPPETLVRDDSPALGPVNAKVTIVEFLDPECESCASFSTSVKQVHKEFDGRVRLVVRYMPLHPNSVPAANFLEAAGEQGKYWQAQELLFSKQHEWGERHGAPTSEAKPDIPKLFDTYARQLGLDAEKVNAAIRDNKAAAKLDRDRKDGMTLGVRQTPTIFVNGRKLARLSESDLRALVAEAANK